MILLIVFTVLIATLTCLFAYLFDQIFGISKPMVLNPLITKEACPEGSIKQNCYST